LTRRRYSS